MSALTKRGSKTRAKILEAAFELFHEKGVHRTSPGDIIERSGTGKGQFYHYFGSKEGLVHAVLQQLIEQLRNDDMCAICADIKSLTDLENWFEQYIGMVKSFNMERACPIGQIASEIGTDQELLRQDVNLIFELVSQKISQLFLVMQAKGELNQNADPAALAEFCLSALQGGAILAKTKRSIVPLENVSREVMSHIRSYSSVESPQPA